LIGKSVIGVFHTLSRGNTEHGVPGKTTPNDEELERGSGDARASSVHDDTTLAFMTTDSSATLAFSARLERCSGAQLLVLKSVQSSDGKSKRPLARGTR